LADRIIKLETANRKTNLRPVKIGALIIILIVGIRMALPKPPERIRTSVVTDEQLVEFIRSSAQLSSNESEKNEASLSTFGQSIYHDNDFLPYKPGRSGRNESCSGCHDSDKTDQKFLATDRLPPDLRRTKYYQNFGADGRADSLEDYIAKHLESPAELSSTRIQVIRIIRDKHRDGYVKAFGPLPSEILGNLPDSGTPAMDRKEFPVATSSFILQTLADRNLLANILRQAQVEHLAPAVIVSRSVFSAMLPEYNQTEKFEHLGTETQNAINVVFDNVAAALAAYIQDLPTSNTRYDLFAEKVTSGLTLQDSLTPDFGNEELLGLRLFWGEAKCSTCHNGPSFTDNKFHNIGLPKATLPDPGRATGLVLADIKKSCLPSELNPSIQDCNNLEVNSDDMNAAVGAFRTPALRGLNPDGPLMRNGQIDDIEDAIKFYSRLDDHPAIGSRSPLLQKLDLTREETAAVISFLQSIATTEPRAKKIPAL